MSKKKNKQLEVVFAPGCFDDFEGTQEELDALVEEIKTMVMNGEIETNSKQIDIENLSEEELEKLEQAFDDIENDRPSKRILN